MSSRNDASPWTDDESLFRAVQENDMELVQSLIVSGKYDLNITSYDENEMTVLHYAVDRGNKEMVELLLSHNANVNATDYEGNTPLILAVVCEHIVSVLA